MLSSSWSTRLLALSVCLLAFCWCAGALAVPPSSLAQSTFATDSEGWEVASLADSGPYGTPSSTHNLTFSATGGNPDGHIWTIDPDSVTFYFSAPAAFLGNKTAAIGFSLEFDFMHTMDGSLWDDADVVLVGGGNVLVYDQMPNPTNTWGHFSIPLDAAQWKLTSRGGTAPSAQTFSNTLANLTALYIRGEYTYGSETARLDNVVLYGVPYDAHPDLWIRNNSDATFAGNGVYGTDGVNQEKTQTLAKGATATYLFRAQNDSADPDALTITGPTAPAGWSVKYFANGVGEVTAQVTGAGWTSPALAPGASASLWATVKPDISLPAQATLSLPVTARSGLNFNRIDVVRATTIVQARVQPDLTIRAASDAAYLGNDVYNLTGYAQTVSVNALSNTAATAVFRVQNDGNTADAFTLTGPAGSNGWTVKYYATGVGEVTTAVTGAGYTTPAVVPGAVASLWVTAVPNGTAAVPPLAILITATSSTDGTKQDAVKAVMTPFRPDLQVRTSTEGVYTGNNVYNLTGDGQSKLANVTLNTTATFFFQVQNDSAAEDSFTLKGTAGTDAWSVRYYAAGLGEITTQITGAGWSTTLLPKDGTAACWATVTPRASAVSKAITLTVTAASVADATKQDVTKATAQFIQPDLAIRTAEEAAYTGNNVYNETGDSQAKQKTAAVGTTVTYFFRVQNDGAASDTFTLTAPAGSNGWTVRYYAAGLGEITNAITTSGWTTSTVASGAILNLWVTVAPGSGTPVADSLPLLITAASGTDPARKDAVKTTTLADNVP